MFHLLKRKPDEIKRRTCPACGGKRFVVTISGEMVQEKGWPRVGHMLCSTVNQESDMSCADCGRRFAKEGPDNE